MQTDKFFSLVKQLIGKELVTEVDSPSDFSLDNSSTLDTSSFDDNTVDLGLNNSQTGGAGLTPTYDIDVDMDNEDIKNQQNISPAAPKFRILDVIFDDDDDINTKVKIQNIETGKTEIKNLDQIII